MTRRLRPQTLLALPLLLTALAPGARAIDKVLSDQEVRTATELILAALQRRDARQVYAALALPLRQATSVARVASRLQQQPPIRSARIQAVALGFDDATVLVSLATAGGELPMRLILDDHARLLAWEIEQPETDLERRAMAFLEELAAGRLVAARTRLSLTAQRQWPPQRLQQGWNKLVGAGGPYQGVRGAVVASEGGSDPMVLVQVAFQKITDQLVVRFDRQGRITAVDLPVPL